MRWSIFNYIIKDNFGFAAAMLAIYLSSFLTDWQAGRFRNLDQERSVAHSRAPIH